MDWNWFFSTLSQSAAATTGIFGAFIITKIFSNQSVFLEKKSRLKMLLAQANKISADAKSCDIGWYNKTKNDAALKEINKILQGGLKSIDPNAVSDQVVENLRVGHSFSIFSPSEEIHSAIRSIVVEICNGNLEKQKQLEKEQEERRKREERQRQSEKSGDFNEQFRSLGGSWKLAHDAAASITIASVPSRKLFEMPDILPHAHLDRVLESAKQLHSDAKHHATIISDFLDSIRGNPESPAQISVSLLLVVVIFILGVMYPLSFMPMAPNINPEIDFSVRSIITTMWSIKGFLLISVSTFFVLVVGIFFHANKSMKYPEKDVKRVEEFVDVNAYFSYFKYFN